MPDTDLHALPGSWRDEAAGLAASAGHQGGASILRERMACLESCALELEAALKAPEPEPPLFLLPDGEYARVEIMGHDQHTGWVTDGTRAGVPVLVVKDWDGYTVAEIPGGSLYRFVPLPMPLKRPDPRLALPVRRPGCVCGPDSTGEDIDMRYDCPVHGGDPF